MTGAAFWAEQLAILSEAFVLRGPRPGPGSGTARETFEIPLADESVRAIERIAGGGAVETFVLLVAALQIVLSRHVGGCTVVVVAPPLAEAPAGLAAVPLIGWVDPEDTVKDVAMRADRMVVDSYEHQALLPRAVPPGREAFATSNVLVRFSPLHALDADESSYDLVLDVRWSGTVGASIRATLDPSRLPAWFIEKLARAYAAALSGYLRPDTPIGALDLLPAEERRRLRDEFAATAPAVAGWSTLADGFEAQARRRPEHPAVVVAGRCLDYATLDARAGRLARILQLEYAVSAGELVAVLLPKSEAAIVAILGVLKAGAAYVPVDPELPQARIEAMLASIGCRVVVLEAGRALDFAEVDASLLAIDVQLPSDGPVELPSPRAATPQTAAYAIFTSGSTGVPKAVLVEHGAIVNYVAWKIGYYGLDAATVTLQLAPLSFDSSVSDLFTTLLAGGTLVLVNKEDRLDARKVGSFITCHGVTIFAVVPSLYHALLADLPECPSLHAITVAGERMTAALVRLHRRRFPHVRLVNEYGPTECAVCVTVFDLTATADDEPLIGRPIAGVEIRLLDEALQLVPLGVAGEICATGACLARGYAGDEALTASRFVPDPDVATGRMYRTGDIGRWLPDGNLEFLGRRDSQVKIRGNRVELGEIEGALRGHPDVHAVVVVLREVHGEAELVAYLVAPAGPAVEALREHLGRLLPDYMIPQRFVALDALPLNRNGKVDRAALPEPGDAPKDEDFAAAPTSALERELLRIFRELLDRDGIGVEDDFFSIGGHSLKAIQLMSRVHRELALEVSLRDVFDHPTVRSLAQACGGRRRGAASNVPIVPAAESHALSHAQRRLWILHELQEGAAYNVPEVCFWDRELDARALATALSELCARHEILRTRFFERDGEPRQCVEESARPELVVHDLAGEPEAEEHLRTIAREQAARPFDPGVAPLLRVAVVRMAPDRHAWILVMHHLVGDDWSMRILLRDLVALYEAACEGKAASLPPLPIQYKDYAAWHAALVDGEEGAGHRDYWVERLRGASTNPAFPADRQRPAVRTNRGASHRFDLDADDVAALRAVARASDVGLFMALVAALKALLYRYTGERDISVGMPIAGRIHPDLHEQVGFYLNTLVLRDELSGELGFSAHVERVKRTMLDAYEHQVYPFDRLVAELNPARDPRRNPLFDVMVTFEEADRDGATGPLRRDTGDGPGGAVIETTTSKFDLTIAFVDRGTTLAVEVEYNPDLHDAGRIERFGVHLAMLLRSAARDPAAPIDALEILPPDERARVLDEFNRTTAPFPEESTLLELFLQQVRRRPDAVAVATPVPVTYAELARRAGGVAHALRQRSGVGPGDVVATVIDRSAELVVALLGILGAGAAYLPIDPRLPPGRVEAVLAQARCRAALVDGSSRDGAPHGPPRLDVRLCDDAGEGLVARGSSESLAYVIFTSGSAGRPKGVMIEHRSAVNFVHWHAEAFAVGPESRASMCASVGFDASVMEIWPYLARGAALYPVSDEARAPEALAAFFRDHGITHAFVPTPLCTLLCETSGVELRPELTLLTGGDTLALRRLPAARLYNEYGPTEATVVASVHPVTASSLAGPISIGRPIANAQIYVLDASLRPLPIGVDGEIVVGGVGVARGYLDDEASSAGSFIADPFRPGGRLYRTGDVGRWRADGTLEFRGRRDRQIKVRGHRVELAEIEHALAHHPAVERAVVVAVAHGEDHQLVAHVIARAGHHVASDELTSFLRTRLPAFMVPAHVVSLAALPLSATGKIDLTVLPIPSSEPAGPAPSTPLEQRLAAIWTEVLGAAPRGRDDDFFALGGHSLAAMRLASRIREAFAVEFPLSLVFQAPTLAAQAEALSARPSWPRLPPLVPRPDQCEYPLSMAQETMWRAEQALAGVPLFHVACPMTLEGPLDDVALERALTELTARHAILRTTFLEGPEGPVQRVGEARPVDLARIDLRGADDLMDATLRQIRQEALAPLDVERGPLLRAALFQLGPEQHILLLTLHHMIVDGASLGLVLRDLAAAYLAGGAAPPHAPPALQYGDYAAWQRQCVGEGSFDAALAAWSRQLAGASRALLRSGRDEAPDARLDLRTATVATVLPAPLARAIRELGRGEGATPFMTVLTGLMIHLARTFGGADIRVGTNLANRGRPGLDEVVGPLVNTVVLRADLSGDPSIREALARVRTTTLAALAHQEVPFEHLVQHLERTAGIARSALFEVMFLFQDGAPAPAFPGLSCSLLDLDGVVTAGITLTTCDLLCAARLTGEQLELSLKYKLSRFSAAQAEALLAELGRVLESMTRAPEAAISSV